MRYSYRRGKLKKDVIRTLNVTASAPAVLARSVNGKLEANGKIHDFVESTFTSIKRREMPAVWKLLDEMSFKKLFSIWFSLIIAFGFVFFLVNSASPGNGLKGLAASSGADSLLNSVYFSFITATSTGFGDITPIGISKLIAIIEVVNTLILFSVFVSKLVSFKQDVILNEIYDIALDEKVNSLRSALYVSASDIGRVTDRLIIEGKISKMRVESLWTMINVLHENMMEIGMLICPPNAQKSEFIKNIDSLHIELIISGVTISLGKITELLEELDSIPYNWRFVKNVESLKRIISAAEGIRKYYSIFGGRSSLGSRIEEMQEATEDLKKKV